MQEESLRMIVSSGDLLVSVVNDVLDFAKLESGHVEIESRKTVLQELMDTIVYSVATKAEPKGIKLKTSYDHRIPPQVDLDGRRLQVCIDPNIAVFQRQHFSST